MKMTFDNPSAIREVTIVCTPVESLMVMAGLRKITEDTDEHEGNRALAKRMYAEMTNGGTENE